ncbi:MAG: hypothetical protein A4E49_00030 [Methanosaeta sp. PtaU1.Bin112]|nr:MAG: hypothetical protein A4E49_00030 [Methanosaeta sp. PtaU1.Bin112]
MGEKSPVDDLCNLLISALYLLGLGDVKHDHLCRQPLVNEIHKFADSSVLELILEEVAVSAVQYCRIGQYIAQILGKGRLAGAKETGDPDSYAFMRLGWSFSYCFQERPVVILDPVCSHILRNLRVDCLLIQLVHLNYLFNDLV